MIINYPSKEFADFKAVQEAITLARGEVTVNILSDVYGELYLDNLQCASLRIVGGGNRWSGALPITLDMELTGEHVLSGAMPISCDVDRLKMGGENMILARYPNSGGCTMAEIERRANLWNAPSGRVRALHEREWGGNCYKLSRENGKVKLNWIGNNNRGNGYKDGSLIVENIYEELDSDREWFYDKQGGKLYVYLDRATVGKYSFELLCHRDLLTISNCNNTTIAIDNINFCDTAGSMFSCEWQRYLRSDWAYNKSATLTIKGSSKVAINGCAFTNLGNNAVGIYDKSSDILISNSQFADSLSGGVLILGDKNSTYCNSCWDGDNHITQIEEPSKIGAKSDAYPSKIGISSCWFHNLGLEDKQCAAVCISLAAYVTVEHCTVHDMPRAGINIAENAFGGHEIIGNDIFDCVRETGDHGPFNSWGRDRYWSLKRFDTMGKFGNIKREYALIDMFAPNKIIGNRICGAHGFGIDLDDGSSNYIISRNLCCGVGIKLREGFFRRVEGNALLNAPMDLHVSYCGNEDIIQGNIIACHQAFRIILPNKGNTTKIEGNTIINNKSSLGAMISRSDNKIISITDKVGLASYFATFLDRDYGVATAPKPTIEYEPQEDATQCIKLCGARLSSMNDEKRSACGAPDLDCIYVDKVSAFGYLARLKVKRGDVIIAIDGERAMWQDAARLRGCKCLVVIRNQLSVTLNK